MKRQIRSAMLVAHDDIWTVDLGDNERIIAADHEGSIAWVYIERYPAEGQGYPAAEEQEYRNALHLALRALMHAEKLTASPTWQVRELIQQARAEVDRVLDIGRDEAGEMTLT